MGEKLHRLGSRVTRTRPAEADDVRAEFLALAAKHRSVGMPGAPRPPGTLEADGVSVRFGATYALSDVTITVGPGEVVGLIGPNGSGKTTLMDVLTGFVPPLSGRVSLDGAEMRAWSPRRRGAAGIARSFQSLELFEDMTVMENMLVASEPHAPWDNVADLIAPGVPHLSPEAVRAMDRLSLWDALDSRPGELSYGRRRLLAIARAIASEPRVLLLDEPASGLNPEERAELSNLVRSLAHELGVGVLLIEHDVDLVMRTSDRVVALEFGRVIAQGSPEFVRTHPDVIRSYLGEEPTEQNAVAMTDGR